MQNNIDRRTRVTNALRSATRSQLADSDAEYVAADLARAVEELLDWVAELTDEVATLRTAIPSDQAPAGRSVPSAEDPAASAAPDARRGELGP